MLDLTEEPRVCRRCDEPLPEEQEDELCQDCLVAEAEFAEEVARDGYLEPTHDALGRPINWNEERDDD